MKCAKYKIIFSQFSGVWFLLFSTSWYFLGHDFLWITETDLMFPLGLLEENKWTIIRMREDLVWFYTMYFRLNMRQDHEWFNTWMKMSSAEFPFPISQDISYDLHLYCRINMDVFVLKMFHIYESSNLLYFQSFLSYRNGGPVLIVCLKLSNVLVFISCHL